MVLNPQLLGMIKKTRELLAGHAKHVSDEPDREKSRRARQAKQRRIKTVIAQGTFAGRGFSTRTCNVLREHGVFTPERLLVMPLEEISRMRGVGKFAFAEIAAYRARHQG